MSALTCNMIICGYKSKKNEKKNLIAYVIEHIMVEGVRQSRNKILE